MLHGATHSDHGFCDARSIAPRRFALHAVVRREDAQRRGVVVLVDAKDLSFHNVSRDLIGAVSQMLQVAP